MGESHERTTARSCGRRPSRPGPLHTHDPGVSRPPPPAQRSIKHDCQFSDVFITVIEIFRWYSVGGFLFYSPSLSLLVRSLFPCSHSMYDESNANIFSVRDLIERDLLYKHTDRRQTDIDPGLDKIFTGSHNKKLLNGRR